MRSEEIAVSEQIPADALRLLLVAAAYHDIGYLQSAQNHEAISSAMAKDILPPFGYTDDELATICGIIMATKLPQTPHTILEQIICDADLDYLGRDDFFDIGKGLYKEMRHRVIVTNEEDWNRLQVSFLENHHYFTATAIAQRQAQKEAHLQILKQKLSNP